METAPQKQAGPDKGPGKSPARKPPKKITETYLRNYGLFYLGRFASSVGNFRKVMRRRIDNSCRFHKEQDRAACNVLLEKVIADYVRAGLLNDEAYARGLANSLRRRGLSGRGVLRKLEQRGIAGEAARAALAELDGETGLAEPDIVAALRTARKKRIGPFAGEPRPGADAAKLAQRAMAALARAGFDYDTCARVMEMKREDAEEKLGAARL
jgi:regulatory protein